MSICAIIVPHICRPPVLPGTICDVQRSRNPGGGPKVDGAFAAVIKWVLYLLSFAR